jgi:hypothetical protein
MFKKGESMNNIFITEIYPTIEKSLSDKKTQQDIKIFIQKFIDENSSVLFDIAPKYRLFIKDSHRSKFYEVTNSNETSIKLSIKKIKFINSSWKALNNPFNFLMLGIIRFFELQNNTQMTELTLTFLALQFYAMYQARYFPYVQDQVMDYTINNLSNKHDLKQFGSIFKAIYKKIVVFHESYKNKLHKNDDKTLIDYIVNLNTRIKQWIQGIMNEYIHNKNSGKYFNSETDNYNPDEYNETSNISQDITRISQKIVLDITTHPVQLHLAEISAKMNDTPRSILYETLDSINRNNNQEKITELLHLIINVFIVDYNGLIAEIGSKKFVNGCLLVYGQSNTINKSVLRIKEILDHWLVLYNDKYNATEREATKTNWRKSIFIYYVFCIQFYNNK